jgi:hypothetical protein
LKNLSDFEKGYKGPKRFSRRGMKVLAQAEKRLAPALCGAIGNGCVKRRCWRSRRDFAVSGINKIIRVTGRS